MLVRLCPELPEHVPVLADPGTMQVLVHPDLADPARLWEAVAYVQAVMPHVDPIVIEASIRDCIDFERLAASTGLDAQLAVAHDRTVPLPRGPVVCPPTARTAVLDRPVLPARTLPVVAPVVPARTGPRLRVRPAFAVIALALGVLAVVLVGTGTAPISIRTTPDRGGPDAAPTDGGRGRQGGSDSPAGGPAPVDTSGRGAPAGDRRSAAPSSTAPASRPPAGASPAPAGPDAPAVTVAPTTPTATQTASSDPPVTAEPTSPPPTTEPPIVETTIATEPPPDCTVEVAEVGVVCTGQP